MKVTRSVALKLFQSLQMKSVDEKLSDKALEIKLNRLDHYLKEEISNDVLAVLDDDTSGLIKDIMSNLQKESKVKVVPDMETENAVSNGKAKKPVKVKAKKEEEELEDEDEEEEEEPIDDTEEEEEEEPTPKKKPAAKGKGKETPKKKDKAPAKKREGGIERVGIVSTILDCLKGTSKNNQITKIQVLDKLVKKFPKREAKGMKHTVDVQLNYPKYSSLIKQGNNIVKTEKGYYLGKGAPAEAPVKPPKKDEKTKPDKKTTEKKPVKAKK